MTANGACGDGERLQERAQETARTGREPQWQKKSRVLRKGLQGQGKGTLHSDRNLPLTGQRLAHRDGNNRGSSRGRNVSHERQREKNSRKGKKNGQSHHLGHSGVLEPPAKGANTTRRPVLTAGRLCGGRSSGGRRKPLEHSEENPGGSTSGFLEDARNPIKTPGKPTPFEGSTGHFEERARPGLKSPGEGGTYRILRLGITPASPFFS